MFKKLLVVAGVCWGAIALAGEGNYSNYNGGMYLGLGVGYQNLQIDHSATFTAGTLTYSESNYYAGHGVEGNAALGYGLCLGDGLFAELQLEGDLNNSRIAHDASLTSTGVGTATIDITTRYRGSYGFSFRPGIMITNRTFLYGDIGYSRGRFSRELTETASNVGVIFSGSAQETLTGVNFGLGLDTMISPAFGLRFEYIHTQYKSFTFFGDNTITTRYDDRPRTEKATVNLVWRIGYASDINEAISEMTY